MLKYSASYTNLNINFCVNADNIKVNKKIKNNTELIAVTRNIINRSSCSKPSTYLKNNLGKNKLYRMPVNVYMDYSLTWDNTIKGGDLSNPALDFYLNYLRKQLNNKLLYNSFLPEAPLNQVILSDGDNLVDNYLDFYSPKLKLAIEIDGIQHRESKLQDNERDLLLKNNGITIVRIPTYKIKEDNQTIINIAKRFKNLVDIECDNPIILNYNACIRYQMMILQLLEDNLLPLQDTVWDFNVIQNDILRKDLLSIAVQDILIYINNLRVLQGKTKYNITTNIVFNQEVNDKYITVDLDIYKKYDETNNQNIVYIRNDYFDYNMNANVVESNNTYPSCKNYYKVSNGNIKYNINKNEETHKSLTFFLKTIFGFDDFLKNQEDIIVECLNKGNVIGLLPTGAGKSLCYQLCSYLIPGTTLVISPLKILMKDQCDNLLNRDRIDNVSYINSANKLGMYLLANNQSKIVLVSPERFFDQKFLEIIRSDLLKINFITLDEVHCLSEWGHDFRTSYLCLMYYFKNNIDNDCRLLGLTATASPRVCEDIRIEFNSFKKNTKIIQADSLERDNLNVCVSNLENKGDKYELNNKYKKLLELYKDDKEFNKKTIVFTLTKSTNEKVYDSCYNLCQQIKIDKHIKNNLMIDYFSGSDDKNSINNNDFKLDNFKKGDTKLLFATKAFGMGIDIPDIRRTIHYQLPSSIESLYQEFGRAGRDGKPSDCLIWYYKENDEYLDALLKSDNTMQLISNNEDKFNEFDTSLFFLTNQNLDIEEEIFFENYLYDYIKKINGHEKEFFANDFITDFYKEVFTTSYFYNKRKLVVKKNYIGKAISKFNYKDYIEKALYRLYLLGKISMWGMKYTRELDNPIYTNIELLDSTIDSQINCLESYIQKYEPLYYYDKTDETTEDDIVKELTKWTFSHFVYQRLQSLKNLYECCTNYKDSKTFMKTIVNFLYNNQQFNVLISDPNNYKIWFNLIAMTSMDDLKNIIARYLENDDKIVSLNYIASLIRLLNNDYENADGRRRMKMALEVINTYKKEDQEAILRATLKLIKTKELKDKWINTALEVNSDWFRYLYKKYQNEELEQYILLDLAKSVIRVGEKINDKFR